MMNSVNGKLIADRWAAPFNGTQQNEMYQLYYEMEKEMGVNA